MSLGRSSAARSSPLRVFALALAWIGAAGARCAADQFGAAICALGDVNGDGCVDFAISDPTHPSEWGASSRSKVAIVCGRTRTAIAVVSAADDDERLGCALASVPDLDGDRVGDLALVADSRGFGEGAPTSVSRARIGFVSTRDGRRLGVATLPGHAWDRTTTGPFPSISSCPDVDGDGREDIAVGCSWRSPFGARHGFVQLLSSRTLELVRTIEGPVEPSGFGARVLSFVAPDGSRRLIVGSNRSIDVHAGAGLEVVRELTVRPSEGSWDDGLLVGPDLDGDGVCELLAVPTLPIRIPNASNGRTLVALAAGSGAELARWSIPRGERLCFLASARAGVPQRVAVGYQSPRFKDCGVAITALSEEATTIRLDLESILWSPAFETLLVRYRASHTGDFETARRPWGGALAPIGDVDGDGIDDVLVGGASPRSDLEHLTTLLSGADGRVLDLFWRFDPRLKLRD